MANTGYQQFKILDGYGEYINTSMPNISTISPSAIVPNTATITYNYPDDIAPTGGVNGDVWYNYDSDELYKKVGGSWLLLTDRIVNTFYIAPVYNPGTCLM